MYDIGLANIYVYRKDRYIDKQIYIYTYRWLDRQTEN